MNFTLSFCILIFALCILPKPTYAIVDPLAVPNNRFGIHIIQATPDESSPAADLVNTNGDWGYVTVLVESKDRNHNKWQEFFNDLRRRHLIPLVRIATQPDRDFWKLPYEGEEIAWADFLDALNWPTKNRYVIIYNEPNHAAEWGNKVDATSYAKILEKTITALKNKSQDFFVLNAGLDASTPNQPPRYLDEVSFLKEMEAAVPGIFDRLDGWVSHSYPNPNFSGSPDDYGKGTVWTWEWEKEVLKSLGVNKKLPIFITETGWKHAEGIDYNRNYPTAEKVASYYLKAFRDCWNNPQIVAVTPFLLNYQDPLFDHFSFKKITNTKKDKKIVVLAAEDRIIEESEYYPMYQVIQNLPKNTGRPVQETKAQLVKGEIYSSLVAGENYVIDLTFKNTGQSIWNDRTPIRLNFTEGGENLGLASIAIPRNLKIEPGQEFTFKLAVNVPNVLNLKPTASSKSGSYKISLNLYEGNKSFESSPIVFTTKIKPPVILKIKSALGWKNNFAGNYILTVKGPTGTNLQNITLDEQGLSEEIENRYLLPDYTFFFTLEKPYYKPITIGQTMFAGLNTLDFGSLQPSILSTLVKPSEFWKLLPFSEN